MSHVRGQPWQPRVQVNARAVPALEPMDSERVSEVVGACADAALRGLQSSGAKESANGFRRRLRPKVHAILADEESVVGLGARVGAPRPQVAPELRRERRVERDPACAPLARVDEENPTGEIYVSDAKAAGFPEPKPRAVQDEQ